MHGFQKILLVGGCLVRVQLACHREQNTACTNRHDKIDVVDGGAEPVHRFDTVGDFQCAVTAWDHQQIIACWIVYRPVWKNSLPVPGAHRFIGLCHKAKRDLVVETAQKFNWPKQVERLQARKNEYRERFHLYPFQGNSAGWRVPTIDYLSCTWQKCQYEIIFCQSVVTRPAQLVFVIYPQIALLDLAGPLQVFAWARRLDGELGYEVSIVSHHGGRVASDTLVSIDTDPIAVLDDRTIDTLVIIGGDGVYPAAEDEHFVEKIVRLASRSKRVCSVCSGAYLLGTAGLLEGRRAVTHWQDVERLRRDFPNVLLETDPIFVQDGDIWTSAGVTSGTDMALAIVAKDLGHDAALERAQALVTYMVRPGGQSQFSPVLERQRHDRSGRFDRLHDWIAQNLTADLRVEQLAEHENMSLRSFHRAYLSTMGTTPARGVEKIRLEVARDKLESSGASIKVVASKCGFASEGQMRRAFSRVLRISPSEYRERFRVT